VAVGGLPLPHEDRLVGGERVGNSYSTRGAGDSGAVAPEPASPARQRVPAGAERPEQHRARRDAGFADLALAMREAVLLRCRQRELQPVDLLYAVREPSVDNMPSGAHLSERHQVRSTRRASCRAC